jgi:P27 family predicted phage terminase small subunit
MPRSIKPIVGKAPTMPNYLPSECRPDWDRIVQYLMRTGTHHPDIDGPLGESWCINLHRLRQAHRAIAEDGPFPDGKSHPAQAVITQASASLAKVAQAFGVTGTSRTALMLAAKASNTQQSEDTGAWAQAAALPAATKVSPIRRGVKT